MFIDEEYPDAIYEKIDIEDAFAQCRSYGIRAVPSIVIERDDEEPIVLSCGNTPEQWKRLAMALGQDRGGRGSGGI